MHRFGFWISCLVSGLFGVNQGFFSYRASDSEMLVSLLLLLPFFRKLRLVDSPLVDNKTSRTN